MPDWFKNQIREAFKDKNINAIKLLNRTWYRGFLN